jgi:hypothetical protein
MFLRNRLFQLTLVMLSLAPWMQAQDRESCSNATLHGSYGLHATGTLISGAAFADVGRFTFDGNVNVTGKLFTNTAGNNNEVNVSGTYSVSPECIVTDNWSGPIGGLGSHVSIIVDNGKGYDILNNSPNAGGTISGEARRQ